MQTYEKQSSLRRAASKGNSYQARLAIGLAATALLTGPLQAQVTLDPAWRVTPDTNQPGFKWSYFQAGSDTGNNNERTESDLAGLSAFINIGDPLTVGAAIQEAAPADPANGLLYFEITNVINLSKTDGGSSGLFPGDQLEPGINLTASTDGQSAEILSYVTLPVGTNYMGVRSDDGFRCQSGPNPQDIFGRRIVDERPGGAGDKVFSFIVPAGGAGTYPFRVIWENGGGDSHVEWYTADSLTPTIRLLVNDVANGGIPAYRAISGAAASPPYVKNVTPPPVARQTEGAQNKVTLVLSDGTTPVNTNSITLLIDGNPQTLAISRSGSTVTADSGVLGGLHLAGERHTAVLTFSDTGTYSRTQSWAFYNLENLILPASPVTGENFDAYAEATDPTNTVPPGWTVTNYTWLELTPPAGFGVWDLTDVANDPFVDWVMITTATVLPLEDEVLDNLKTQTINGIALTNADSWMSNNLIFAASDGRARRCTDASGSLPNDYAPQIQITVSAPFNLSSVTNPVLTFSSGVRISGNHEQNTLEYSVDNGTNWLPVMIMQNSATVFLNPDGTYDAVRMLTNVWTDVAKFPVVQDSSRFFVSSGPLGQKFGDVLATPISQDLAAYVVNRNDGQAARKVEAIRLPAASKKSQVRLRFIHYGSCGWEWGIDNIAFYDIAPSAAAAPVITSVAVSGGVVTVQWSNGGALESSPSLTSPVWTSTGNSTGTFSEPATGTSKFYRVRQ